MDDLIEPDHGDHPREASAGVAHDDGASTIGDQRVAAGKVQSGAAAAKKGGARAARLAAALKANIGRRKAAAREAASGSGDA